MPWRESSTEKQRKRALGGIGTLGGFQSPGSYGKGFVPPKWGGQTILPPGKGWNQQMATPYTPGTTQGGQGKGFVPPDWGGGQTLPTMGGKGYPGSMTGELPYGNWQPPPGWTYERQQPTQTEITDLRPPGIEKGGPELAMPGQPQYDILGREIPPEPPPGGPEPPDLPGQENLSWWERRNRFMEESIERLKGQFGKEMPWPKATPEELPPEGQQDFDALAELPYGVLEQYKKLLESGIYGPEGIEGILQRSIYPAQERTQRSIQEMLSTTRAGQAQVRSGAARMLSERLGGRFASQPGLAAKLIGDQIIAPSLAKEAEMSVDIQTQARDQLNALNLAIGDLMKENMQSQLMGLAGIQDVMGFLQQRVSTRWWDSTMRNKYGWTPQEIDTSRGMANERFQQMLQEYGLDTQMLDYMLRDWLDSMSEARRGDEGG